MEKRELGRKPNMRLLTQLLATKTHVDKNKQMSKKKTIMFVVFSCFVLFFSSCVFYINNDIYIYFHINLVCKNANANRRTET